MGTRERTQKNTSASQKRRGSKEGVQHTFEMGRTVQQRKSRRRSGGGTLILVLLILLVLTGIAFFVKDSLSINLPFFGGNVNKIMKQADELAQTYDYDGALTLLKGNEKFNSNKELQDKAAEYEQARTVMNDTVNATLEGAAEKIGQFDYQGAIDLLKNSQYYETSVLLQDKAAQYEEALENGGAIDGAVAAQADALTATYDYDGAIETIKNVSGYESNPVLTQKVSEYEAAKAACVEITPQDVTHIFYHSLVVEPSKGFVPGSAGYDGWQQWMTTVYEFDKITQSMYDRGYVLVALDDLYGKETAADGTTRIVSKSIYLPEGKKAFVMSLDDLSYYHTYDDHGVASKIILDEEGKPTCEYIQDDGTVVYGDYDVVPRLDAFLEEHPDGCYKGARGTIALTGYDGILGYRTDGAYSEEHNTNPETYYADELQLAWLAEHPDFDWERECAEARKVVDAMKAEGWTFANHTWGHKAVGSASYESVVQDTERWMQYVSPLIGETDKIIFAHGEDIAPVSEYMSSDKFQYLKGRGFDVYCPVDSTPYTAQITDSFFHQGRRNLDGYRIYQDTVSGNPLAADLFDANEVLDPERPLPVPDL